VAAIAYVLTVSKASNIYLYQYTIVMVTIGNSIRVTRILFIEFLVICDTVIVSVDFTLKHPPLNFQIQDYKSGPQMRIQNGYSYGNDWSVVLYALLRSAPSRVLFI